MQGIGSIEGRAPARRFLTTAREKGLMGRVVGVRCHESRPALAAQERTEAARDLLAAVYARLTEGSWILRICMSRIGHI
jgi:hypothetical protein